MNADGLHARTAAGPVVPADRGPRTAPAEGEESGRPGHRSDTGEARFLRPFAVDAGNPDRAGGSGSGPPVALDLTSLVMAARTPGRHEWLRPEREVILHHACRARTVAELAAEVRLPLGQVRSIVSDMVTEGSLQRCGPSRPLGRQDVLHAVLVGLRAL